MVTECLETLEQLLIWALAILTAITGWLTAIGFLVTFVTMLVGGVWLLGREIFVRLRSLRANDRLR